MTDLQYQTVTIMSNEMRLYQAALKLDEVLTENKIGYGIFGGWAINALGSGRGTKDIDCFVAACSWVSRVGIEFPVKDKTTSLSW
jgi:hypothetical protein